MFSRDDKEIMDILSPQLWKYHTVSSWKWTYRITVSHFRKKCEVKFHGYF
jgi:hypothetical protein